MSKESALGASQRYSLNAECQSILQPPHFGAQWVFPLLRYFLDEFFLEGCSKIASTVQ